MEIFSARFGFSFGNFDNISFSLPFFCFALTPTARRPDICNRSLPAGGDGDGDVELSTLNKFAKPPPPGLSDDFCGPLPAPAAGPRQGNHKVKIH